MKLSYKQIAVFGQVKVDINPIDCKLAKYTTLLELYKQGWWVTDRTGAIITIVKPKNMLKFGFCCLCKRISTEVNLDMLDSLTKPIADAQYEKYKEILQSKVSINNLKNIEKKHEMSFMPSRNRNILYKTQTRTNGKISVEYEKTRVQRKTKKNIP